MLNNPTEDREKAVQQLDAWFTTKMALFATIKNESNVARLQFFGFITRHDGTYYAFEPPGLAGQGFHGLDFNIQNLALYYRDSGPLGVSVLIASREDSQRGSINANITFSTQSMY